MLTLVELIERLKDFDETRLLEMLNIQSEDIVERFADVIEDSYDFLLEEVEELPYGDE
jgi:hypothetical protein